MKIIFVSNNWADAHQQVRLNALLNICPSLICLAFTRKYYPSTSSVPLYWQGKMEHASYLKRWKVYIQFLIQLYKTAQGGDIVYVYGFDLAALSLLVRFFSQHSFRLVYEIPDIREMFFRKDIAGSILRWIEQLVIPNLDILIVTSSEYITDYYQKIRHITVPSYLVIENKLHRKAPHLPSLSSNHPRVRIGYFGLLRCKTSLNCLLRLANTGCFEIILRGIFMPNTSQYETLMKENSNISYLGPFDAASELDAIYASVDIVWAVYPYSPQTRLGNHLWARTNRFYESLFFQKPLILQEGTCDAKRAQTLGNIAIIINLENIPLVIHTLVQKLNSAYLKKLQSEVVFVSRNEYIIQEEYQQLSKCLQLKK